MARTLAFKLPETTQWSAHLIPLESIPDDVKAEVEEAYTAIKANPAGRISAEFDTVEELNLYTRQVTSYCAQHDPVWRFRKSPTKGLSKTQMDFKITDPLTKNEETTAEIREVTDAVKEANGAVLDPATKDAVAEAMTPARKNRAKSAA
jgi:hypothetical protein